MRQNKSDLNRKELAFVLGATGNMAFAAANVVMGISEYYTGSEFDIIIYCDENFSKPDKSLLNDFFPCEFIIYNAFKENTDNFDWNVINRFTTLAFSRYECFGLLEKYKKVIWFDIDILINNNINELPSLCREDIALYGNYGEVQQDFFTPIHGFNMNIKAYNSGVVIFNSSIENYKEIMKWCYSKTIELSEFLKCPDQGILNLSLQNFNLKISELPEKYNCHPDFTNSQNAVILHPFCMEKFWNYYEYSKWRNNYRKWLKKGGSKYTGKIFNPIEKALIKFKKKYFLRAPDPFRHTRKFIRYIKENRENVRK